MNIFKAISFFLVTIPFIINATGKQPFTPTCNPDQATSAEVGVGANEPAREATTDITEIISRQTSIQEPAIPEEHTPVEDEHIAREILFGTNDSVFDVFANYLPKQTSVTMVGEDDELAIEIAIRGIFTNEDLQKIKNVFKRKKLYITFKSTLSWDLSRSSLLLLKLYNTFQPCNASINIKNIIKAISCDTEELHIEDRLIPGEGFFNKMPTVLQDIATASKNIKKLYFRLVEYQERNTGNLLKEALKKIFKSLSKSHLPQLQTIRVVIYRLMPRVITNLNADELENEFKLTKKNIRLTIITDNIEGVNFTRVTITLPPHEQDDQAQPSENNHEDCP